MAEKSSVNELCRLVNDLESKEGMAMFLLSVDFKGAYDRFDNVLVYKELRDSGIPEEWRPCTFKLLFIRSFKVISYTGNSSSWTLLRIGARQGSLSAAILPNLYINATLKELNEEGNGSHLDADDNTLGIPARAQRTFVLCAPLKSPDGPPSCPSLQRDHVCPYLRTHRNRN